MTGKGTLCREAMWRPANLSAINVVEDFHDLMKVMNDPDLNEFQYTIENGEWIVHLK